MAKRLVADDFIYIAVYQDEDGKECFTTWGSWGNRQIRWYKTRKEGERQLSQVLNDKVRGKDVPKNSRIVRFQMEVDAEDEE